MTVRFLAWEPEGQRCSLLVLKQNKMNSSHEGRKEIIDSALTMLSMKYFEFIPWKYISEKSSLEAHFSYRMFGR